MAGKVNGRITLKHMSGSFVVLLVGIVAVLVIFVVELILCPTFYPQGSNLINVIPLVIVKPVNEEAKSPAATVINGGNKVGVSNLPASKVEKANPDTASTVIQGNTGKQISNNSGKVVKSKDKIQNEKA